MKKVKKCTVFCFLFIILFLEISPCQIVNAAEVVAKNNSSEWYEYKGDVAPSVRWKKTYGLLARNVKSVKASTELSMASSSVFISQREGEWWNIDFSKKYTRTDKNGILYKNNLAASQVSDFYPVGYRELYLKKGGKKLLYTGIGATGTPFLYSGKGSDFCECLALKTVGDCWYDDNMLAYVKNGALRICDRYERAFSKRKFLVGKTGKIRKVVSCADKVAWPESESTFFVLMKDGTVWGIGNNRDHIISNEDKEYYSKFVKLKMKNVKDICAANRNVGILKKDGSLWVWGQKRSGKNGKDIKFTPRPWRIANGVQSFSM